MAEVLVLQAGDPLWDETMRLAEGCSWKAGPHLAKNMREGLFTGWQRVFAALVDGAIAGFCTLAETDCVPGVTYGPYIGYVFVGEAWRGSRISEQMITCALAYARGLGFGRVYLVSDQVNLYEKYGFIKVDERPDRWGRMQKIYVHPTGE